MKSINLLLPLIVLILLTACGAATTPVSTQAPATEAPTIPPAPTPVSVVTEAPTMAPPPTATVAASTEGSSQTLSPEEQMAQIDDILKKTLGASIAYNKPDSMILDQTTTIELLLNPSLSPEVLSTQITEPGPVTSASIQITPRMKAVLIANDETAFIIKPIHDDPEQLISETETTRWSWLVTAKKSGPQRLTLIVYRLVEFDGQNYWREVKTYKADIDIQVTLFQRIESLDWAWIVGIIVSAIAIPAFWRWYDNRNKKVSKRKVSSKE